MDVVLASNNGGKLNELAVLLGDLPLRLLPQSEFGLAGAEESGATFIENAILKARHAAQGTGLPALADDSGLVVPALGGAPGVLSARFAGPAASDRENIDALLAALEDVAETARAAMFVCVMIYLRHAADPLPLVAQAVWHGRILERPRGARGFGYDPVFWVDSANCAAAELEAAEKNAISHRGQAVAGLREALAQELRPR